MTDYVDSLMADLKPLNPAKLVTVYPGYLAFFIARALEAAAKGDERIIAPGAAVQSLGNSVYGVTCRDHQGTEYEIIVKCKGQ